MPEDVNLPNLVSHLQVNLENTSSIIGEATRQGSAVGAALGESMQRRVEAAVNNIPPVVITDDSNQFDRDLDRIRTDLQELSNQRIGVDISVQDAIRQLDELEPHLDRLARTHPDIDVRAFVGEAAANLADLREAARAVPDEVHVNVDLDAGAAIVEAGILRRSLGNLGDVGGRLGRTLLPLVGTLGKVTAGFGAAIPVAAGLASTLVDLAPAAAVAVTAGLAAASAGVAMKLGLSGVPEALTAAFDPSKADQFDKALAKLSPNAQSFVLALKGIKPQLDGLKLDVQNRLFSGLDSRIGQTAAATLPTFKKSLTDSAGALNQMGKGVLDAAKGLGKSGTLGTALDGANKGLLNLSRAPGQLTTALGQIGAAAAPAFDRLTQAGGKALDRLSGKVTKAFESGGMEKAIDHAVDLLKQIGDVGGNVVSIVGSIFHAAEGTSGGTLGVLQDITGELAKVAKTKGVQDALKAIFTTVGTLGKTVAPLIGQALTAIGPVLTALGPPAQRLIESLGDGLSPIIVGLGPVLEVAATAVGALTDAAGPLLVLVGQLAASLLPALVPLLAACQTVFEALGTVIADDVVPVLQDTLTPLLADLPAIIGPLADLLARNLILALKIFGALLVAISPSLVQLSQAFADLMVQLGPAIDEFTRFTNEALAKMAPLIPPLLGLVGKLAAILAGSLARQITDVVIPAVHAVTALLRGDFSGAWSYAKTAVVNQVKVIIERVTAIPRLAVSVLATLGPKLFTVMNIAFARMVVAAEGKIREAVAAVRTLPGKARAALGNLGGVLAAAGRSLISGLVSGIKSKFAEVQKTLSNLTSKLPDWKGPKKRDAQILTPAGKLIIQSLIDGIDASTSKLKAKLGSISNLIERAISINKTNKHKVSGLGALSNLVAKDTKKLLSLAKARDKVATALSAAQKKLTDLQAASAKVKASITEGILGDADITKSGTVVNSVTAITVGLQQSVAAAQKFADNIKKLKTAGLRSDLLQEIADAGVSGGGATADALAKATPAELKRINDLQAQLAKAAAATGTTVSDALYKSGINAAQGLVDGLKAKEGALEKQMKHLADVLVSTLEKKLKIHSPSLVAHRIGEMFGTGMENGVISTRKAVAAAGRSLASAASTAASTARAAVGAVPAPGTLTAAYAGTAAAGDTTNNFYLNGGDATPDGIVRALSWRGLVGG